MRAMKPERPGLRRLALIFTVALGLRLVPVVLTADMGIALDDMFQYDALAESIRLGQGYTWYGGIPTAARAPLYPLFLAIIFTLFGHQFLAARVAQALVGSWVPVMVYVLGRRMADERAASIASWIVACFPMFLFFPLGLATENLFFVLVPLTVLCLLKAADTSRPAHYLLAGFVLGLSMLTRSLVSGFVVLVLPWLWHYTSARMQALRNWGLILLSVGVLTAPWSIRNSLLYDQFVFVESSLGFNLYLGYHPDGTGTFDSPIAVDFLEQIGGFDAPGLETEKLAHNLGVERTLQFVKDNPCRAVWLLLSKASHFLRSDKRLILFFYSNNFLGELPAYILFLVLALICMPWVIVSLLSVPGMVLSKVTKETALVYLLCLYLIGIHMLIMAEPRFHLALVPFLSIFAAQGIMRVCRLAADLWTGDVRERRIATWQLALCLLLMGLLVFNWIYELNVDMNKLRIVFSPGGNLARFTY